MPTPVRDPETKGIEGRQGEVRLADNSGHAIFVTNDGTFIVRYKRDIDWDGPAPDDTDTDVIERRYETMTDVRKFIDRRYETQQRVKNTPLNIRVLTEFGPFVVKGIHGGTNKPLFIIDDDDKRRAKQLRKDLENATLYPDHDRCRAYVDQLRALLEQKEEIETALSRTRSELYDFRIRPDSGYGHTFRSEEQFTTAATDALSKVKKVQQEVDDRG